MPDIEAQLVAVFEQHLDLGDRDIEKMARKFLNVLGWKPFTLYDRKKDLEALDRIIQGLSHLDRRVYDGLSVSARKRLDSRLGLGADCSDSDILDFMQRSDWRHSEVFHEFLDLASELRSIVKAARRDIEESERTRRTLSVIKSDRLQLVQVAAPLWADTQKRALPGKGIKETHPLAKFLAALFELLDMDTSPAKAYDGWLKQKESTPLQAK